MNNNIQKGLFLALSTAIISGFSIFYNKLVAIRGIDPVIFNIVKNGGVGIILTLFLLQTNRFSSISKLTKSDWKKLSLIALIGGSIPFVLFFTGLTMIPATNASLIHKTLFLWVAAMAIPLLGERLKLWQILGYMLIAWSNIFIGGFKGLTFGTGELMIFGATLLWSFEQIIAKIALKKLDSTIVAWGRMSLGSIFLLLYAISQQKIHLLFTISPSQLMTIAGSILLLAGYVTTWYKALKYAPATLVSAVLIVSVPITNLLTGMFITHTLPAPQQILSLLGILGGVGLISIFLTDQSKQQRALQ
ncbi:DMT family transporter [Patescibacteria group bacterium]